MDTKIKLVDLSTGYGGKVITPNINASLRGGELTCLLGPNGAGKSTLLKTLCAFIPPLKGEILIEGSRLADFSAKALAQSISVVLTERPQAMNMTVQELVSIGRSPYTGFFGRLSLDDTEIIDRAISMVGIEDLRHRSVMILSDGERQKAMIAKALAQQTPIIVLDEPTAFLDYPSKVEIMKLLYRIAHSEGKTVFMSTHDLDLAIQIADKIWLLDKTRGLNIGIPEDLAYRGTLPDYFASDMLKFDYNTGQFNVRHDINGAVNLKGSGPLYNMVRRALNRQGYRAGAEAPMSIEITTDADGKEAISHDGTIYHDIEHLLMALRKVTGVYSHVTSTGVTSAK